MNVLGDVQAVKALDTLESRLHWNDPPAGVEWKLNVAVVWFVAAGGAGVEDHCGVTSMEAIVRVRRAVRALGDATSGVEMLVAPCSAGSLRSIGSSADAWVGSGCVW